MLNVFSYFIWTSGPRYNILYLLTCRTRREFGAWCRLVAIPFSSILPWRLQYGTHLEQNCFRFPSRPADPICGHQWTRPVLGCDYHLIPLGAFWICFLNFCFLLFIFHILFKYKWIIRIIFEYSNLFRDSNIFEPFFKSRIIFGFGFKNFLIDE